MKHFVKKIFLFIFSLIPFFIIIISYNYVFDSYGVIKGNMENQYNEPNQHYLKINHLLKNPQKYNSYILGSSRVGKIDTRNISDGNSWYNLSYSEAVPYENLVDLKLLLENDVNVKNVVLGLDNISYLVDPKTHLNQSLRKSYNGIFTKLYYLTLKPDLALQTEKEKEKEIYYDIYNSGFPIVSKQDSLINLNKEKHVTDSKFTKPTLNKYYNNRVNQSINEIIEIINICDDKKINLIIFINPMHLTTYADLDEQMYFNFLTLLAKQKTFYDFSGVNKITSNNFNYYETSHYRPLVGELIKSVIINHKKSDFYHLINEQNIDSILKLKKNELDNIRKQN